MDESILLTIKKLLGLDADYTPFDTDVIVDINAVLGVLNQLGVGNATRIKDSSTTWNDFLSDHNVNLDEVITYVFLRVQMIFDPPTSSLVSEAKKEMINELGWRLNVKVDPESGSSSNAKVDLKDEMQAYARQVVTETLTSLAGD